MICHEYLYDKEYYGSLLSTDHFKKTEVKWRELPGGIVIPFTGLQDELIGGLLNGEGEYIDGSGIHRGMGAGRDIRDEQVEEYDEDIVFLGVWPDVWGHCLTDNIRRLWVVHNEAFMKEYGHLRFLYVPFQNKEPSDNFRELLQMVGISDIKLESINTVSRFRKVILPDECFWREQDGTRMFTSEFRELIDRVRDYAVRNITPAEIKKTYFTYRKHPAMRVIGERKLEKFFSALGYTIISPEKHSLREQMSILLGCEEFACTVGSASHNSIFLRDGAKVTLIPRAGFISEYQPALDQVHDLDITYADSSLSLYVKPDRPWDGPFYYIVSDQLRQCFGQRGRYKENRKDFKVYRALAFALNGYTAPAEYYKKVVSKYMSVDPEWDGRWSIAANLLRHQKVRRIVTAIMG